jgi:hypothetical protein
MPEPRGAVKYSNRLDLCNDTSARALGYLIYDRLQYVLSLSEIKS